MIAAHDELQERELIKLASWSGVLADGLVARGVDRATAGLAAETGLAVFRVAFERWVSGPSSDNLVRTLDSCFEQLQALTRA